MNHKKPTGKDGFTRISFDDKETKISFIKNKYPEIKEEIEKFYFENFFEILRLNFKGIRYQQNEDDNKQLDFTIKFTDGEFHIDLMEIAPINNGGYENERSNYKVKDIANWIERKVEEKSNKYTNLNFDKALLLYSTDFKFFLSDEVIVYLQIILSKNDYDFLQIFYINCIAMEKFVLYNLLDPKLPFVSEEKIEEIGNIELYNFDPENFNHML